MKRFVLFDIDGTLIYSGGAGVRSLNGALQDLTGIEAGFRHIDCAGKTDMQIIREGLNLWGVEARDGLVRRFIDRYLAHLRFEMTTTQGHVKPGITELLRALQEVEGIFLGLLTGNLEEGARLKLGPFGLNPFFPVGAYGSDAEDRNELLPVAMERLSQDHGIAVDPAECVVVGDTPRDVACARVHGAPCIAVATGPYPIEALKAAGADLALPDLSDTARVLRWLKARRAHP